MAKIDYKEAESLSRLLSKLSGDSASLEANLQKMFASQDKGLRSFESKMRKVLRNNAKEIKKNEQQIDKLTNKITNLTKAEKQELETLKQQNKEMKLANAAVYKYTDSVSNATSETNKLTGGFSRQINTIRQYVSVTGILTGIIEVITSLYQTWAEQQQRLTQGMGRASQALGMNARQFTDFQARADNLRQTMSNLGGEVDGWTMSLQHTQEVMLALRQNVNSLGAGVEEAMLRTAQGFGIGNEQAAILFRFLETGVAGAGTSLDEFGADMLRFANSIGANASQLEGDFIEARRAIGEFGADGTEVFRNAAMMANEFHFETNRIFSMMRQFDTFSQASQNVNQLNAMFGTTLSSYELMLEQDPSERLEIIREQFRNGGIEYANMSRQQIQLLEQITGEGSDVLGRVFGQGRSLDEVRAAQQRAENEQRTREERQQSAQEVMNGLLLRSSQIWDSLQRQWGQLTADIAHELTPVFKIFHQEFSGLATQFREWVHDLMTSGQGEKFIRNISNWIRDAAQWLRNVEWAEIWERTQRTWRQWEPTVQTIGSAIMSILEFASENPEVIAALFAGAAIARFSGILGQIPAAITALNGAGTGVVSTIAAGVLVPLAALLASYGLARAGEEARQRQGERNVTDHAAAREQGTFALEELSRRGGLSGDEASRGSEIGTLENTRSWLAGTAHEYLGYNPGSYARSLGFRTTQQTDVRRNSLRAVIDEAIAGRRDIPTERLASDIRRRLGENRSRGEAAVGGNLEEYIRTRRAAMGPMSNMVTPESAMESAAAARTATAGFEDRTMERMPPINIRVQLDGREIGRSHVERAQGGRTPGV